MRRRLVLSFVLPATLIALAGCGGSDEEAAEQMLEQLAESQGEDVDIEVDGDGGVVIKTEDGEFSTEQGQDLPDDFPSEVPVSDDWVATSTSRMATEGEPVWFVTFETEAAPAEAYAELRAAMAAAGFTEAQTMESGSADTYSAVGSYLGSYDVFVTVTTIPDKSSASISLTVAIPES